jgi:hypothetical protein
MNPLRKEIMVVVNVIGKFVLAVIGVMLITPWVKTCHALGERIGLKLFVR